MQDSLPAGATLRRHTGHVTAMRRTGAVWQLRCADGRLIDADRVVLATGHPLTELSADQARFADFATRDARLEYIRGDSAADMPLERIAPGARVAVLGMGLTFYDIVAALTTGRGGEFREGPDKTLRYVPCGLEPVLVAGSRSGVPLPARGVNQKGPLWRYPARLFTPQRVAALRAAGRPLDFRTQVWPWLHAEMQLVYYATEVRARLGDRAEQEFLARAAALVESAAADAADEIVRATAAQFGVDGAPPLDVDDLARPFAGRTFRSPAAFHTALRRFIDEDLEHSARGNFHGPRKAALDVLRDVRGSIRRAVDFDGLTAASHRADFLGWFAPLSSFLAAGPPAQRLRETRALLDAGVLRVAGPSAEFAADADGGASPSVPAGGRLAGALRGAHRRPHPRTGPRPRHRAAHPAAARHRPVDTVDQPPGRRRPGHRWCRHHDQPLPARDRGGHSRRGRVRPGHPLRGTALVHAGRVRAARTLDRLHRRRRRHRAGRARSAPPAGCPPDAGRNPSMTTPHSAPRASDHWIHRRTPAHAAFRRGRDLLLDLRADHEAARRAFSWPRMTHFNWALEWFDVIAHDNRRTALELIGPDGRDQRISYQDLATRSDQLANWLTHVGVRRGDRVLIVLGPQVELWETLLACLKTGAVAIPTYTSLTRTEASDRIGRGRVRHVICRSELAPLFASCGPGPHTPLTRIAVGAHVDGWHPYDGSYQVSTSYLPTGPTPASDTAFAYFTSGTTSAPKLVVHTHASYPVGHLSSMYFNGLIPGDRHVNISEPGWAKHSWSSFFVPFTAEATLVVPPTEHVDSGHLPRLLRERDITSLCAPPPSGPASPHRPRPPSPGCGRPPPPANHWPSTSPKSSEPNGA